MVEDALAKRAGAEEGGVVGADDEGAPHLVEQRIVIADNGERLRADCHKVCNLGLEGVLAIFSGEPRPNAFSIFRVQPESQFIPALSRLLEQVCASIKIDRVAHVPSPAAVGQFGLPRRG